MYVGAGKWVAAPKTGEAVKVQDVGKPTVIRRVRPEQPRSRDPRRPVPTLAGAPYANLFGKAGSRYGVAPRCWPRSPAESGFNSQAGAPAGAQGLMQFMPATAEGLGVDPSTRRRPSTAPPGWLSSLTEHSAPPSWPSPPTTPAPAR